VLLEHYVDSRTQWSAHGKMHVNFGYEVLRQWSDDSISLQSAPSLTELADMFAVSASGRFDSALSDEAKVIRDAVTAWCVRAQAGSSEGGGWSELEHMRSILSQGSPFPDGKGPRSA
jgi:hypothetical protein